ncbi:RDD family protein [Pontibacillus yanchengensis]|uniref:RDD family protein n=1 Tax=Pontibacillus yanchengensis TaxID=462910 RepID=UPI003C6E9FF8
MEKNPAGFWIRLGAILLDGIALAVIFFPISIFLSLLGVGDTVMDNVERIVNPIYSIVVPIIWSGYVIGKRLFGIRIVKMDDSNVDFLTMVLRVVVSGIIYIATIGIGFIVSAFMIGLRDDKRAIHDLIAGTYVTYNKP